MSFRPGTQTVNSGDGGKVQFCRERKAGVRIGADHRILDLLHENGVSYVIHLP